MRPYSTKWNRSTASTVGSPLRRERRVARADGEGRDDQAIAQRAAFPDARKRDDDGDANRAEHGPGNDARILSRERVLNERRGVGR